MVISNFFVLEGIDASGKTSVLESLSHSNSIYATREPSPSIFGEWVRLLLQKDCLFYPQNYGRSCSWSVLDEFFSKTLVSFKEADHFARLFWLDKLEEDLIRQWIVNYNLQGYGVIHNLSSFIYRDYWYVRAVYQSILQTSKQNFAALTFIFWLCLIQAIHMDREQHLREVLKVMDTPYYARKFIISDRYIPSTLAYQGIYFDMDFLYKMNKDFMVPGIVFMLDTPLDIAQERIQKRNTPEQEMSPSSPPAEEAQVQGLDSAFIQKKILDKYVEAEAYLTHVGWNFVHISHQEDVTHTIMEMIEEKNKKSSLLFS